MHALKEFDLGKLFQVKRNGKDRNNIYWQLGKIHGLENIAYADPEEVKAAKGNPVRIQRIVDKIEAKDIPKYDSYEHLVE